MLQRITAVILSIFLIGCTHSETLQEKAVRLVSTNYPDCEKIVHIGIDTVTFGDNLDFRINQANNDVKYRNGQVEMYENYIKEFKRYGSSAKSIVDGYKKDLHRADSILAHALAWRCALDSLKQATVDIANTPTAYTINIQYNYIGNMVWVQLANDGTFLKMSKNHNELLLNPGEDMPGYFETYKKYHE